MPLERTATGQDGLLYSRIPAIVKMPAHFIPINAPCGALPDPIYIFMPNR
jgi:hypothetical protein